MPRKKHRLSWMYEGPEEGAVDRVLDENALDASPVEVVYSFNISREVESEDACVNEMKPDETTEASPGEDYPTEGPPIEEPLPAVEEPPPPVEELPVEEPPAEEPIAAEPITEESIDEEPITEESIAEKPLTEGPPDDECPGQWNHADEIPRSFPEALAEEWPRNEAVALEPLSDDEVPFRRFRDAKAETEEPAAEEMVQVYSPLKAVDAIESAEAEIDAISLDSDQEAGASADKIEDGEVVVICTSCIRMLLIKYDDSCPYTFISSMASYSESYAWLIHTTCFACVNKHKQAHVNRDKFSEECQAAFAVAMLSEEFVKRTDWFELADQACEKPVQVAMNKDRRSVAYEKIDVLREQTTEKCRIKGLRSAGWRIELTRQTEIFHSFVPGGFL